MKQCSEAAQKMDQSFFFLLGFLSLCHLTMSQTSLSTRSCTSSARVGPGEINTNRCIQFGIITSIDDVYCTVNQSSSKIGKCLPCLNCTNAVMYPTDQNMLEKPMEGYCPNWCTSWVKTSTDTCNTKCGPGIIPKNYSCVDMRRSPPTTLCANEPYNNSRCPCVGNRERPLSDSINDWTIIQLSKPASSIPCTNRPVSFL